MCIPFKWLIVAPIACNPRRSEIIGDLSVIQYDTIGFCSRKLTDYTVPVLSSTTVPLLAGKINKLI